MVTTNVSPIQTTARPFVPYRPIKDKASLAAPKRPDYLDELIREICARTPKSKAKTQTDRFVFASNRNITGLTPALKEITYQIIAERTAGSRIWDIDGNEYIDLTMGFGSSLLGHRHPAVTAALHAQIDASYAVGPIANQAGDVARLVSELTGMQRVAFFNSGTEAVMVAIRLARAVTGKPKIVIFEGSYHGMFDGVLGVAKPRGTYGEAISMAPGVPDSMIDDVLMLRYDDPYALEVIEARAAEIGAVLVEPVQSRQPNLQPRAFLHRLREITRQKEIALVFDEMITGFRAGPDGAQTWFAVDADIATYGKVIGGGMPIGIVAGSAEFLDALDGGMWHYGDDSFPTKTNTFVAGTFCAHPLTMASARVLLEILVSEGPALQRTLNTRTRRMCARLNDIFANERLPIHVVNFASLFRIVLPPEFYLFFHRLVSRGIYVGELRNLFLTTAHSDDDINQVVEVVRDTAKWLARFVLPEGDFSHSGFGITQIHATSPQRVMFARCQRKHAGKAYHVSSAFRVFGALQMDRIEPAITELVRRHQSLRTCFLQNGDILWQRFHPVGSFELAHETIDEASIASFVDRVIAPSFDLTMPGLFRCAVGELTPNEWLLVFDIHHLIVDGISMERIVEEFFILYSGGALSEPIAHYAELVDWERLYLDSEKAQQDESFWRSMLLTKVPRLEFPADFPPEDQRQFEGSFVRFQLSDPGAFRAFAREHETTVQVLLNAIFRVFSWVITGQTAVRFGSPTAGRPTEQFEELVGLFIGVVVYQAIITGDKTFATILQETRTQVLQAFDAQHYPFERIAELAGCTDGQTPFEVGFSYEASRTRGAQRLGDLEIVPYPVPRRNFSMEIVLICLDDAESFNMRIAFNPRRFRHQTVEAWTVRFNELAHALIAAPNQPLLKFQ
jgi:glutamate-1-semialdehyde aminotransferase